MGYDQLPIGCSTGDPRVPSANTLPEPTDTVPFTGMGLHYLLLDTGIATTRVPAQVSRLPVSLRGYQEPATVSEPMTARM